MKSLKMCWNLVTTLLTLISLTLSNSSEARNVKHTHPSAVLVGTVYCDTCFQDDFSRTGHFISGATVSVECKDAAFMKEVKTDEKGEFQVHLPVSISKQEKEIKGCKVNLLKSSEPHCSVASTATTSSIQLKSKKQETQIFSAGFFTFKPLEQPDLCNQKSLSDHITNTPLTNPLPQLPSLPPLPTNPNEPPKQTRVIPEKGLGSSMESITRPQFFFPPILPSPPPAVTDPLPPNIHGLPSLPPPALPVPFPPMLPVPPVLPVTPVPPVLPVTPIPPMLPLPPLPPLPPVLPVTPLPPVLPVTPLPPIDPGVPPANKMSP